MWDDAAVDRLLDRAEAAEPNGAEGGEGVAVNDYMDRFKVADFTWAKGGEEEAQPEAIAEAARGLEGCEDDEGFWSELLGDARAQREAMDSIYMGRGKRERGEIEYRERWLGVGAAEEGKGEGGKGEGGGHGGDEPPAPRDPNKKLKRDVAGAGAADLLTWDPNHQATAVYVTAV